MFYHVCFFFYFKIVELFDRQLLPLLFSFFSIFASSSVTLFKEYGTKRNMYRALNLSLIRDKVVSSLLSLFSPSQMIDSNEFESALSSTNFSLSSLFRASQTQILIYYFSLDLFDQISNTARIRIESFASPSKPLRFLILLTVPSFQFFLLLPHQPVTH